MPDFITNPNDIHFNEQDEMMHFIGKPPSVFMRFGIYVALLVAVMKHKTPNLPILTKQNLRKLNRGESFLFNFERVQNFCTPTYDLCNRLNNNGQQNDAGGFGCVALEY